MKKLLLFSFLISLFILPLTKASAETSSPATALKVTPVIIPLQLSPHQKISKDIVIENFSSTPQPLRAAFSDFDTTGENGGYEFQATAKNPLLSWTKVTPAEVIVAPHSKETVTLTITTPDKIPVGGYFGMLFFEPVPQPQATREATQIVARIGVLLLGSVGVQDTKSLSIETFDVPLITNSPRTIQTVLRLKNTGLQYITAKPILTLHSFSGQTDKTIWEDKVVFPGTVRRWDKILQVQDWNIYRLTMNVSIGGGKIVSVTRTLIVFPYQFFLGIIFVIILIGLLVWKGKNLKRALNILLFNK